MKQVKIKEMTLHYFKGIRNERVEFGPERTTITGPNGSGKTTVMDAFFWCLWGKNAQGRADFTVKTVDKDGVEIAHVDHEVRMTLTVNGEEQTFERRLVVDYDKEDRIKGNHTEFGWQNVPMKKSEYDQKVTEVITEEVFKLIASPTAFLTMDWQKQRQTLLKMAGEVNDEEVADTLDGGDKEGEYHTLLKQLTGKTLEELKRELDARIKKTNEEMQSIPARMDEVTRNVPAAPDMEAIRERRETLEEQLSAIDQQERDDRKALEARNAERKEAMEALYGLETRRMQLINAEEAKVRTAIHEGNQTYNRAEAEMKGLRAENELDMGMTATKQRQLASAIERNKQMSTQMQTGVEQLREDWRRENGKEFAASEWLQCPLYGHTCTDGQACQRYDQDQQGAYETWSRQKTERLRDISVRGGKMAQDVKDLLGTIEQQIAELEGVGAELEGRSRVRVERMTALEKLMTEHPKKPLIANVDPMTVAGVKELDEEIRAKKEALEGMKTYEATNTDNSEAKRNIRTQLDALSREEAKQQQIEAAQKRLEELQEKLTELGALKAELEMQRKTAQDFEVARMTAVSERVNGLFRLVRWRMFQRQVNGEEVPACICLVDGVRWADANTAARMNAGIEVAAVLAQKAQSYAPVFIDNAESNGNIYVPEGLPIQQIRLLHDKTATKITIEKTGE